MLANPFVPDPYAVCSHSHISHFIIVTSLPGGLNAYQVYQKHLHGNNQSSASKPIMVFELAELALGLYAIST